MRITQQQYVELYNYIKEHAIDGGILMKRSLLAEKATAALGFQVSPQKAATTAKAAGVQLICNQKRAKPSEETRKNVTKGVDVLIAAIARTEVKIGIIESKIDALLKAWDVKCGRLL